MKDKFTLKITAARIIYIGVALFIVGVIVVLAICWCIVDNEDEQLRTELNNPYINAGFTGWQKLEIHEIGTLYYPHNWNITQTQDGYSLISPDKKIIGHGISVGTESATFSSGSAFWSRLYACEEEEIQYSLNDFFSGVTHISKGFFTKWNVGEKKLYVITLYPDPTNENRKYYTISFDAEQFSTETEFRQLAEAIIYAYSFGK